MRSRFGKKLHQRLLLHMPKFTLHVDGDAIQMVRVRFQPLNGP